MKIIQINVVYEILSTGRNVMEIDRFLMEQGHESYIVATRLNKKYENVYQIGNKIDWNMHMVLSHITGHQGYFSYFSTKKMLRWMDTINPDVVHLNNIRSGMINMPMLFRYLRGKEIPTVLTLHDCYMYTGRCVYYTKNDCYQWEKECRHCPATDRCEKSIFFDFSSRLFRDKKMWLTSLPYLAVIGVSDWVRKEAERSFLKKSAIMTTIYNWVDLEIFRPYTKEENAASRAELDIGNDYVFLGIAASVDVAKGLNELLTIAENIENIKVILVGRIDAEITLPDNVISFGFINDVRELAKYYAIADVFINPSVEETFGKTTAEALACGTPVVGYDLTATSELISEDCGILVDYKDGVEGMLLAVRECMTKGKAHYSANCRAFAEKHFDIKKNIREYINVYESLIKMKGKYQGEK